MLPVKEPFSGGGYGRGRWFNQLWPTCRALLFLAAIFASTFFIVYISYHEDTRTDDPSMIVFLKRVAKSRFVRRFHRQRPVPPAPPPCSGCIVSNITLRATLASGGTYTKKRYLFENVHLADEGTLALYLNPAQPLPATEPPYICNIFSYNCTRTQPPTEFHASMSSKISTRLRVNYTHALTAEQQPRCKRWEDRPTYVLFGRHPGNIWHALNDALMGAFMTLREEGLLPVAKIDNDLNIEEWPYGLETGCQRVYRIGGWQSFRPKEGCRNKTGLFKPRKCDPATEPWCRPGMVSINRTAGPVILLSNASSQPLDKWQHMYRAVSEDIREWKDEVGTCFKELYIGYSNTLNLYIRSVNVTTARFGTKFTLNLRRRAAATFQGLMHTAEEARRAERRKRHPNLKFWGGYRTEELEVLRRGVGPENIAALGALRRRRRAAIEAEMPSADAAETLRRMEEATEATKELVFEKGLADADGGAAAAAEAAVPLVDETAGRPFEPSPPTVESPTESPRPTVTYIWRSELRRCVLNEADILEYLLSRYNVTVRITTFEEPMLEIMRLMNSTDLLIGMHGAGWTNALFLKSGAAGLQLHPYGWLMHKWGRPALSRGVSYENIVRLLGGPYAAWANPHADHAFIRREDYDRMVSEGDTPPYDYALNPQPHWELPTDAKPGNQWIYQLTVVDMRSIAPLLDALLEARGVKPMDLGGSVR